MGILLLMLPVPGLFCSDPVITPVKYRDSEEVLPAVKSLLSEKGHVVFDKRTNSLVIFDDKEHVKNILRFLDVFDRPARQVRISLRFQENRFTGGRSVSAGGSISGKDWRVNVGKKKSRGFNVDLRDQNRRTQSSYETFVNVASGSSAYILTGKDIPYREKWIDLSKKYAAYSSTIAFKRIETGMDVKPVLVKDRAIIKITPKLSYENKEGKKGTIAFTRTSTSLTIPLGQWTVIGGSNKSSKEVINALIESGSGEKGSSLVISIKADEMLTQRR
jgi:protein transport protein HofQ